MFFDFKVFAIIFSFQLGLKKQLKRHRISFLTRDKTENVLKFGI